MDPSNGEKKVYEKPEIIYESDLEVRAGSPLSPNDEFITPIDS